MSDSTAAVAADTIRLSDLPAVRGALAGGVFAGVITLASGIHAAVVLLADAPDGRLDWKKAVAWARDFGAELPARPIAALLYANLKDHFEEDWYWTSEEWGASYAWTQGFDDGGQYHLHKSYEGLARAVRTIPLTV